MKYVSVGDMAQTYLLRRHNVQLKSTMARLGTELVTGVSQDIGAAVGGDFTALSAINRSLSRIDAFALVSSEVTLLASTQQNTLDLIQGHATAMGATLVSAATTSNPNMIETGAGDAAQRFYSIASALNVNVAGRYAFSGTATDARAMIDGTQIIAALSTAISGLNSAADITAAVDAWFDAPTGGGGFLDTAYTGSSTPLAAFQLSETDKVTLPITAQNQTLRDTLKGFALATLIAENAVPDDIALRSALAQTAGEQMMASDVRLSTLRSDLGTTESIIAQAQTRNSAEKMSLELSKSEMIGIDEYDSATALEAVQAQLETLYTLTSRLSQLSLTDYLR